MGLIGDRKLEHNNFFSIVKSISTKKNLPIFGEQI